MSNLKIFLFVIIISAIIVSCKDTVITKPNPKTNIKDYFPPVTSPNKQNNFETWIYVNNLGPIIKDTLVVKVLGTTIIGNYSYYIFKSYHIQDTSVYFQYFRTDSTGNIYQNANKEDKLYILFDGTKPNYSEKNIYFIQNNVDTISISGKMYKNCLYVTNYGMDLDAGSMDYYYEGVGLLKTSGFKFQYELVSYK
jgi:hypothetical protein